jgi:hypothetical protein
MYSSITAGTSSLFVKKYMDLWKELYKCYSVEGCAMTVGFEPSCAVEKIFDYVYVLYENLRELNLQNQEIRRHVDCAVRLWSHKI